MLIFSFKKGIIITATVMSVILFFYFQNSHHQAQKRDPDISLINSIQNDFRNFREAAKELPEIFRDSEQGQNDLKIGLVSKFQEKLEIYHLTHDRYPYDLEEFFENDLEKLAKFKILDYYSDGVNYTIETKLPDGSTYTVHN